MAEFKHIPIPSEEYDALGMSEDSVLQTGINGNGDLVVHVVTDDDMEEFVCDGDCGSCPLRDIDCDGECLSCPCYASCDDSDYVTSGGRA